MYLDALAQAQERREEVMATVYESNDPEEAGDRLIRLLGLSDPGAVNIVLDSAVRRWTRRERERITQERDHLRASLADN